jgi:gluconate kinase
MSPDLKTTRPGSSVASEFSGRGLYGEFADADPFHPPASVEKMRNGIPLTDKDRWPWLNAVAA